MMVLRDLPAALAVHIAIILLVAFWSPFMSLQKFEDYTLPIEIITIDEFTRIIEEAKSAPKPKPKAKAKPRSVPAATLPDALPLPNANAPLPNAQGATAATDSSAFRVAAPVPQGRPKPPNNLRAANPDTALNLSQVRALLDKTPDAEPPAPAEPQPSDAKIGEQVTISEIAAFRAQMQNCWSPPAGARNAESLVVRVRLSLTLAGDILAGPYVVNRAQLSQPFFRAAAESVLRAIRRCQPFAMPPEKYARWRDIELTFNPSKMLTN